LDSTCNIPAVSGGKYSLIYMIDKERRDDYQIFSHSCPDFLKDPYSLSQMRV
jgi:hypothetical protein